MNNANTKPLREERCNGAELRAFAPEADHRRRPSKEVGGVLHLQCSSCTHFYPGTKEFFYFQADKRKSEEPRAHSWCKPCYRTNTGRSKGMRVEQQDTHVTEEVIDAQAQFVRLRPSAPTPLVGAAA